MKITIQTAFILLFSSILSFGQVTAIKYGLQYNETTGYFEGKLIITAGSATTVPQRIQFNAQYSIVVPTGSDVALIESFMPLQNNAAYTGTIPLEWVAGSPLVDPPQKPGYDLYSITPDLGVTSHYNDLSPGDEIHLFNLMVTGEDVCDKNVRLLDNDLDPTSNIGGWDFSNGFTLGSINQIYTGNETYPSNSDWDISLENVTICPGECVDLIPQLSCAGFPLEYNWSTGSTIFYTKVCPEETTSYQVTITGPGGYSEVFETSVIVPELIDPILNGPDTICPLTITNFIPTTGVGWFSDNQLVATIDNFGNVTAIGEGTTTFSYTDASSGCISNPSVPITVLPSATVNYLGDFSACLGETVNIQPSKTGLFISSDTSVATIDSAGIIYTHSAGTTGIQYFDSITGCSTFKPEEFTVHPLPPGVITGEDTICVGSVTTLSPNSGVTWSSSNPFRATVDNSGVVTGITNGEAYFTCTASFTGCTSDLVGPIRIFHPEISASVSSLEIDDYATLYAETSGSWENLNPELVSLEEPNKILGLATGIATLIFTDSLTECEATLELPITEEINFVQGLAFRDVNSNEIFDSSNDTPLPNTGISIPSINSIYFTDEEGFFNVGLVENDYDFEFLVPYGEWEVNPLVKEITADSGTEYLFAPFTPASDLTDGTIVVGSSILLCNAVVDLDISVFNNGNHPLDGYLVIDIDERSFVDSSFPFPVASNGNQLTWEVSDLLPGYTFSPNINIDIPNSEIENDSLFFKGYLLSLDGDTLKTFEYDDVIACEGDYGTLRSWPDRPGEENFTYKSENLDYTVRFQNPTPDTSFHCVIKADLDENINPHSFKLKNSSHKVSSKIVDNELVIDFIDFVLPPQSVDFAGSQAYVSFEFEFYDDVDDGTEIFNRAWINHGDIFYYTTKKVVNTIVSEVPVATSEVEIPSVAIFPNPASDQLYFETDERISAIRLYSKIGRLLSSLSYKEKMIDVSSIPHGLYFIHFELENGRTDIQKLVIR